MTSIVLTSSDSHLQLQPFSQSLQHSFSHLQSGQPSQQAPLLQVAFLLLQQPDLAAGVAFDDVKPNVPAASAASNTSPKDIFVNIESPTPVLRIN
jgi:hypothetical protein